MIRQAYANEIKVCDILDLAMSEFSECFFAEKNHDFKMQIFYDFFGKDKTRFCLSNIYVYERNYQVIAAFCIYGGFEYNDDLLKEYLKSKNSDYEIIKECENDEFYLDSVAVLPEFRKQGILGEILEFVSLKAKENSYKKISLITKTPKIYEKYGFRVCNNTTNFDDYLKMLKEI